MYLKLIRMSNVHIYAMRNKIEGVKHVSCSNDTSIKVYNIISVNLIFVIFYIACLYKKTKMRYEFLFITCCLFYILYIIHIKYF